MTLTKPNFKLIFKITHLEERVGVFKEPSTHCVTCLVVGYCPLLFLTKNLEGCHMKHIVMRE